MALDLYRTAAQIDAALATADLGAARDRRMPKPSSPHSATPTRAR